MGNLKYHFTYKTTCLITGRFYFGMHSTNDLNDNYFGSGKVITHSLKKHGKNNHVREILTFYDSREELIEGEISLITEDVLNDPNCMNIVPGGKGDWNCAVRIMKERGTHFTLGMLGKTHSSKAKTRMSNRKIGEDNNQFGKRKFVNPETGDEIICFPENKPEGWLTKTDYNQSKKKQNHGGLGKKWYNDGTANFFLSPSNEKVTHLIPGRIGKLFGEG